MLQYYPEDEFENKIRLGNSKGSYPDPIDVVYTWVNGSDEKLISQLNAYKKGLYLDGNLQLDGTHHRLSCPYSICGFNNHVFLFSQPLHISDLQDLLHAISFNFTTRLNTLTNVTVKFITNVEKSEISRRSGMILHISSDISSLFFNQSEITMTLVGHSSVNVTISQVFIAAEVSHIDLVLGGYAFIHGIEEMKDISMESNWRRAIAIKTSMNLSLIKASSTSFLVLLPQNVTYDDFNSVISNQSSGKSLQISKAFLIADTGLAMILSDLSESRYQDNEELRYSLRSLDSFLGFYRHIFLVTNGQVPSWLDTDNPKITVVQHSQIFTNTSHLPTFNSASIEANLHNIPGLAPHFIYLNDDVFFGKPVYEEDFYSLTYGYKVYLGWSVPNCVERCPNSWLADGFCDHECNVPECHWDAGDCIKTHGKVGSIEFASMANQSLMHMHQMVAMAPNMAATCSHGCNHNWLADRYCDTSCNVPSCGYDLGDCGDVNLLSLPSGTVSQISGQQFPVLNGISSYVLNLQSVISTDDNVTKASIDDVKEVVASSYTLKYRLLVVLLRKGNKSDQVVNVNITVYNGTTFKYNIVTHLVLNAETLTQTYGPEYTTDYVRPTTSQTPLTFKKYIFPQTVRFYTPVYSSNMSIEELEWQRPTDMSQYRLLLQDGLISLEGYRHLIQQLWISYRTTKMRNVLLTAFEKDLRLEHLSWGFLPWEKDWQTRLKSSIITNTLSGHVIPTMRHILDLYSDSLRHSNKLLSDVFGISQRRVPAHGPHFISTSILESAHRMFHGPWTQTSGHRFRTPYDIQFAFSYFYYMMSEQKNVSVTEIFQKVDTDKSGNLDENELRSLALILSNNDTITDSIMKYFLDQIRNNCMSSHAAQAKVVVNITELSTCVNFFDHRPDSAAAKVYQFMTLDDADLAFIMISPNRAKVLHDLDILRKHPKKFFCLNDNLPSKGDLGAEEAVRRDLHDFLDYMFPFPSQFEKSSRKSSTLTKTWVLFWKKLCVCVVLFVVLKFLMMKLGKKICNSLRWIWKCVFKGSTPSLTHELLVIC